MKKQTAIIDMHTEKLERFYKIYLHLTFLPAPNGEYAFHGTVCSWKMQPQLDFIYQFV